MSAQQLVDDLARLASMSLDPQARAELAAELPLILAYVDVLRAVDTAELNEGDGSAAATRPLRPDEVGPSMPRSSFLPPAPRSAGAYFAVPSWRDLDAD